MNCWIMASCRNFVIYIEYFTVYTFTLSSVYSTCTAHYMTHNNFRQFCFKIVQPCFFLLVVQCLKIGYPDDAYIGDAHGEMHVKCVECCLKSQQYLINLNLEHLSFHDKESILWSCQAPSNQNAWLWYWKVF